MSERMEADVSKLWVGTLPWHESVRWPRVLLFTIAFALGAFVGGKQMLCVYVNRRDASQACNGNGKPHGFK